MERALAPWPARPAASANRAAISRQLRRLAAYLRPYRGHVVGALVALVLASAAVLSMGVGLRHLIDGGFSAGAARAHSTTPSRPWASSSWRWRVATFLRSYLVTWLGERVVADIRRDVYAPCPASLARLLRGHPHRRGAVAADHRHQRHPDRDRRQRHPGPAQRAAGRGRPGAAGGHQPPPDRHDPGRGAGGGRADRRDRPPRPAPLARRAGPHGATSRVPAEETINAIRTVQSFAQEERESRAVRRRRRGRLRRRRPLRPGARLLGAIIITLVFGAIAVVLWLGGQDVLAGRITRRRAVLVRVLRHRGRQRGRRPQRHRRRPAAGRRRHRAAVRAAGRADRDRGAGGPHAAAEPGARAPSLRGRELRLSVPARAAGAGASFDLDVRPGRDGGPGRPLGRRQDQRLPAADALLRSRARGGSCSTACRSRQLDPARAIAAGSGSCRRSR